MTDEQFAELREAVMAGDVDVLDLLRKYEAERAVARGWAQRLMERADELQADCTRVENERRCWKNRAESMRKLLEATLIEMRVHGGPRENAAAALVKEVKERADALERDAWCLAAAEVRAFLGETEKGLPGFVGVEALEAYVLAWRARFEVALSDPP